MNSPETIEWGLPISQSDFKKFVKGFNSGQMEDRWRILPTPKENNTYCIEFRRSWTGDLYYTLEVAADHPDSKGPVIKTITWKSQTEGGVRLTHGMAKDAVIHISRAYMRSRLKEYPEIDWRKPELWDIPI
jgi:hypothetical protein